MKRYILIILILALFAPINLVEANEKKQGKIDRKEWFAKMRNLKHNYLSKEIGLTPEQAEKFFPIYDSMEDEIFKVNRETRKLEKKVSESESASDVEYEAAAKAIIDLKKKESTIELKYIDQFKTILSSKQLFLLKKVERKFTHKIMRGYNSKGKDSKGKNKQ